MPKSINRTHVDYLQLTIRHPGDFLNWLKLGWTAQDPNLALEFFQEALVLHPDDPMVLNSIAWAKGKILNPDAQVNLGDTSEELKDLQSLHLSSESASRIAPQHSLLMYWRVLASRRFLIWWLGFYLSLIALAETLTTILPTLQIGLVLHGLVLMVLIFHSAIVVSRREQRLLLTLAFAPLIRMTSLSIPLRDIPQMYWYMIIGIPLFLAAFLVMRYAGFSRQEIGLTAKRWWLQILLGASGLGLGYLEYKILQPSPLTMEYTLGVLIGPAFILLIFTGFLEEYIFRGLMQRAFTSVIGKYEGILYVSFIFAVLHLGYRSVLDVLFVFWVAVLFSFFTLFTGSILGATIAHGLTNISLFLIFPFLLAPASPINTSRKTPTPSITATEMVSMTPTPFQPAGIHQIPFSTPSLVEILPISPSRLPDFTPTPITTQEVE